MIQKMKLSDIPTLSKLHADLSEHDKKQYHPCKMTPWGISLFLTNLYVCQMLDKYTLPVVATRNGDDTGFAFLRRTDSKCELGIVIWHEYRGQGVGKSLMSHLSSYARSENINVYLGVLSNNHEAIHLYFNSGFKITGYIYKTYKNEKRRFYEMELKHEV